MIKNFFLEVKQWLPWSRVHHFLSVRQNNARSPTLATLLFLTMLFTLGEVVAKLFFSTWFWSSNTLLNNLRLLFIAIFGVVIAIKWLFSKYSPIWAYAMRAILLRSFDVILNLSRNNLNNELDERLSVQYEYWKIQDTIFIKVYHNGMLIDNMLSQLAEKLQGHFIVATQRLPYNWHIKKSSMGQGYLLIEFGKPDERYLYTRERILLSVKNNELLRLSHSLTLPQYHLLLSGSSGTGKTKILFLILSILSVGVSTGNATFSVIDPKRASLYSLRKYGIGKFASTPEKARDLLLEFQAEILKRGRKLEKEALGLEDDYLSLGWTVNFLIVDEFVDLIVSADKKLGQEIQALLISCLTKGRQLGCFLIITAIRPDVSYLPGVLRSSMMKIILADRGKEPDPDGLRMTFNTTDVQKPAESWRFYAYIQREQDKPQCVLTPKLADDIDIIQLISNSFHSSTMNDKKL